MNIGAIGYSNHSGLGQMIKAFRDQQIVNSQMVIKHPEKGTYDLDIPHTFADLKPTIEQLDEYLHKCNPDAVIIIETPFNFDFFKRLHVTGKKVILIPMIDSIEQDKFKPYGKYIDTIIHPTQIGFALYRDAQNWDGRIVHIPWPVDTDYFNPKNLGVQKKLNTFLHNEGFGGAGYRKGTDMVFVSFQQLAYRQKEITLCVRSQNAESRHSQIRKDIKRIIIESEDVLEAIDTYKGGKIYIAPSRREGLGLPIPEAMACGLPVITTGAPPMHQWFIQDRRLLVSVQNQSTLPYGDIPMYDCSVYDLMQKMKFASENPDLMEEIGKQNCKIIEENFSWHALKDKWIGAIHKCCY